LPGSNGTGHQLFQPSTQPRGGDGIPHEEENAETRSQVPIGGGGCVPTARAFGRRQQQSPGRKKLGKGPLVGPFLSGDGGMLGVMPRKKQTLPEWRTLKLKRRPGGVGSQGKGKCHGTLVNGGPQKKKKPMAICGKIMRERRKKGWRWSEFFASAF